MTVSTNTCERHVRIQVEIRSLFLLQSKLTINLVAIILNLPLNHFIYTCFLKLDYVQMCNQAIFLVNSVLHALFRNAIVL